MYSVGAAVFLLVAEREQEHEEEEEEEAEAEAEHGQAANAPLVALA